MSPETGTFPSTVYSNLSPTLLPYRWAIDGDSLTILVSYGPLDATLTGKFSEYGTKCARRQRSASEGASITPGRAGGFEVPRHKVRKEPR